MIKKKKRVIKNKKVAKKKTKKTAKRRPAKKVFRKEKSAARSNAEPRTLNAKPIGVVTHFYNHIKVAIVKFKKPVRTGANVRFRGATTDFAQTLQSLQYDHKPVSVAPKGKLIGIKVGKRVREGDGVFPA